MSKTVTLRLADTVYQELKEAALAENRPLSNLIETAALSKIREQQFVDDVEMAEILQDEALLRRLETASRQARQGEGKFVD
jgi:predicted transcriptional regulator